MTILSKMESVLDLDDREESNGATVLFTRNDPDNTERILDVEIDEEMFKALGSPETITVTVRPGDFLNESRPDF